MPSLRGTSGVLWLRSWQPASAWGEGPWGPYFLVLCPLGLPGMVFFLWALVS